MRGKVKFFKFDKGFGFIGPEAPGADLFFHKDAVADRELILDDGVLIEYDVSEDPKKPGSLKAINVRRAAGAVYTKQRAVDKLTGSPGSWLKSWADIHLRDYYEQREPRKGVLELLKETALEEVWDFNTRPTNRPLPILHNYLTYTFARLKHEDSILEYRGPTEAWAAFNTGLVDRLYEPIYALFERNNRPSPFWKFNAFCRAGIGREGKKLTSMFSPLPRPAKYFEAASDLFLDVDEPIHPDYHHIIYDGIGRNRFPQQFLMDNIPRSFSWDEKAAKSDTYSPKFFEALADAVEADAQCNRAIIHRLKDAIDLAYKRARWNYKTAIPHYFPTNNTTSLLLPLALVNDDRVDVALVVARNQASGSYQAPTVLPLGWAYEHARLVCRPDSDWLSPALVGEMTDIKSADEEVIDDSQAAPEVGELVSAGVEARDQGVPELPSMIAADIDREIDEIIAQMRAQRAGKGS